MSMHQPAPACCYSIAYTLNKEEIHAKQRKVCQGKTPQSRLQAQGCCENEESLQLLLRWTSAFCKVLMWHVREHCDLQSELKVA